MPTFVNGVGSKLTLNLSRLPKASSSKNSLTFRGATPGSIGPFLTRHQDPGTYKPVDPDLVRTLDALSKSDKRLKPWSLPSVKSLSFTLRVVPKKVLCVPEFPTTLPSKCDPNQMSVRFVVAKKVHKFATIRTRMCYRIKEAIGLIITRGATGNSVGGELQASSNLNDAGVDNWVLSDWTYLFYPTLETYKIPLPQLVGELRIALKAIQQNAMSWERAVGRAAGEAMNKSISLRSTGSPSTQSSQTAARSISSRPAFILRGNTRKEGTINPPQIVNDRVNRSRSQYDLEQDHKMSKRSFRRKDTTQ